MPPGVTKNPWLRRWSSRCAYEDIEHHPAEELFQIFFDPIDPVVIERLDDIQIAGFHGFGR